MNCQKCGLPQDTGAIGSVLPQCICHWKHTPITGKTEYEFNIERLEQLVKQLKAEMSCYKIELELHKAMIQDLEKLLKIKERDYNFMKDLAIGEEARAKELEQQLAILRKAQEK